MTQQNKTAAAAERSRPAVSAQWWEQNGACHAGCDRPRLRLRGAAWCHLQRGQTGLSPAPGADVDAPDLPEHPPQGPGPAPPSAAADPAPSTADRTGTAAGGGKPPRAPGGPDAQPSAPALRKPGAPSSVLPNEKSKLLLSTPNAGTGHGLSPLPARPLRTQGCMSQAVSSEDWAVPAAHMCAPSLPPDHTPQAPASWGAGPR